MIVGDGRPLRFLALIGGGWIGMRILFLWHVTGSLPAAVRGVMPIGEHTLAAVAPVQRTVALRGGVERPLSVRRSSATVAATDSPLPDTTRIQLALLAMTRVADGVPDAQPSQATPTEPYLDPGRSAMQGASSPSRLSVSSWLIARAGTGLGASALSPQLGGTQGGVRVDYALAHGLAATGRIAAPAAGAGREVSLGVAWRPSGVPVRIVAEQRVAIDGGRGGPALGISGGVSDLRLPAGFRLEGYGQAGVIGRSGVEKYIDASLRAGRPATAVGGIVLDLGAGAWGGAQRGVARVDVGPSVGARIPLAGQAVRVSLDWRQRIAGGARPGSGPALTLGADF